MQGYKIRFLLNGKEKTINISEKDIVVFYQEKLLELNIISISKAEISSVSDIKPYLKPKKSIFEGI